jgi:hypothetical protein
MGDETKKLVLCDEGWRLYDRWAKFADIYNGSIEMLLNVSAAKSNFDYHRSICQVCDSPVERDADDIDWNYKEGVWSRE